MAAPNDEITCGVNAPPSPHGKKSAPQDASQGQAELSKYQEDETNDRNTGDGTNCVEDDGKRQTDPLSSSGSRHRKLFVGGLGWETNRSQLHAYFSQFGPLVHEEVMYNRDTGVPRGFGFVTFADENDAAAAVAKRHHQINHKTAEIKYAVKKGDDRLVTEPFNDKLQRQVFVGGLPRDATPDEVKEWAAALFGEDKVVSAIVVTA